MFSYFPRTCSWKTTASCFFTLKVLKSEDVFTLSVLSGLQDSLDQVLGSFCPLLFLCNMWSTFFVTDEEGHVVNPAAAGAMAGGPAGGPAQGTGGLANLMSGRSTFGGNKRRRATAGNTMSEAQEGKVGKSPDPTGNKHPEHKSLDFGFRVFVQLNSIHWPQSNFILRKVFGRIGLRNLLFIDSSP